MTRIPGIRRLFRLPWRSPEQITRDVDDELRFHLEMRTQEHVENGMSPDAARARARSEFGDLEFTRTYLREVDRGHERGTRRAELLDEIRQDVRYALRQLRRTPSFTLVALFTLALGIGANTAIFSVVNGVVLRPMPFEEPERVIRVFSGREGRRGAVSVPDFMDFRRQARSFERLAAFYDGASTLTGDGEPERLIGARVTADFFPVLRVRPIVGRTFAPGEDAEGADRVVVLGEPLWRSRFGADPAIVGRELVLDGHPHTVLGVVPAAQRYPGDADIWTASRFDARSLAPTSRGARWIRLIGRLRPGVSEAQARAEMETIARQLEIQDPAHNTGYGAPVVQLQEHLVGSIRTPLLILMGAVGFVMLIACANVANLMLVRTAARETEIAVRTALGAGRLRLVRQLLTESVVLSVLGGLAGFALAIWGTRLFVALAPDTIPRLHEIRVDGAMLGFTGLIALITGTVFGLIPAMHASASELALRLKEGGRGSRTRPGSRRARSVLIVSEMALAVMLLAGAGLLIRSFSALRDVDPGFRSDDVATFTVALPMSRYEKSEQQRQFVSAAIERMSTIPGVKSAAATFGLPLTDTRFSLSFTVEGRPPVRPEDEPSSQIRFASKDYFSTMGIPLVRGRTFSEADRYGTQPVLVINEEAARRFFEDEDPIGKRLFTGWTLDGVKMGGEIVGIVGNVRQFGLDADIAPEMYANFAQWGADEFSIVLRTSGQDPASLAAAARAEVRAIDRNLPIFDFETLGDIVSESVAQPRFYMLLLGIFAGVALALAAVGIYGVISYAVSQRTRELGIRLALGATGAAVQRMVVGHGIGLAVMGVALGVAGALALTRLMQSLLFGVSATDPVTFIGVAALLAAVAIVASWVPARRASRVDPLSALRAE